MSIVDLCIYFVIGLVTVAYPILLQVSSTLDEKYASIVIIELFRKETEYRCFRVFMVSSLGLIGGYAITNLSISLNHIPYLLQCIGYGLLFSTALLIVSFLFFISKILTYYTPSRVVNYFIGKKENQNYEFFNALGDILYYSIDKKQDDIARLIHAHYYKTFSDFRELHKAEPVVYPEPYYALVDNIVTRLAEVNNANFRFLEHRTVGGVWLIGELKDIEISERTYSCLWHLLTTAVRFERDDMVMLFWASAHQHLVYHIQWITADYDFSGGTHTIKNQAAIDKRNSERDRFLEFTYALGGMLLFKNRISCIKRIFTYTSSTPPSYDLLPLHMTQVFNLYFKFLDPYHEIFPFMTRYWYPDTEGIGSEGLVKAWTCKYAAVLLLRQYSIVEYLVTMKPLQLPQIPDKKTYQHMWMSNLDYFKKLVTETYENWPLLEQLNLSFITDEWLKEQRKVNPVTLVEQVKQAAKRAYDMGEIEAELSPADILKVRENTVRIVEGAFSVYGSLFDYPIRRNFSGFSSLGICRIMDKSPFVADKEADYANHYSINAEAIADNLHEVVSGTFGIQPVIVYHVTEDNLFAAVDRLQPSAGQHVLINLGYNVDHWLATKLYPGLTENEYKGIPLYSFPNYFPEHRLYVMHKKQLPYLFTKKPLPKLIKDNHLEEIGKHDLYYSIIDLYRNRTLRDEWLKSADISDEDKRDIDKKVQIYIIARAIIRWKKGMKLTALSITYPYMSSATEPVSLDEIPPMTL